MNRIPVVAVSIGMATGIYAISFGALGVTAGLTILETMLLSLVMFSGASQFAFVGVVATGGMAAIPTAIASAWLLGVRNGFYALRMAPVLGMPGIAKMLSAQLTIDESTAVATAQSNPADERRGFWWTGASVFFFWNLMTLAGALLGDQIGDPANFGLDSAAAAAFLGSCVGALEFKSLSIYWSGSSHCCHCGESICFSRYSGASRCFGCSDYSVLGESMTIAVIAASLAVFSWKFLGYLVPEKYVSNPRFKQTADAITVGLLSALVGIQGFTTDGELTFDSRIPALLLAALLLYLRMPFIVVIASAAALSAIIRMLI